MSQFYKPNRNPNWNYDGPRWRLSRSKIDLFVSCPRCFYVDNKLGTARPPGFPFNLNSAVDTLFKKEFDIHRSAGTRHPIMEEYDVKAVPFVHKKMDEWRENFKGVAVQHEPTGMTVCGAVDDIWVGEGGELYIVDYKSTSKMGRLKHLIRIGTLGTKDKWRCINGFFDRVDLMFQRQDTLCMQTLVPIKKCLITSSISK